MDDPFFSIQSTPTGSASATRNDVRNPQLAALKQAWINERIAPELLPYEFALLASMRSALASQTEALEAHAASLGTQYASLYAMDVERIRFLIAAYTRVRLSKIVLFHAWLRQRPTLAEELLSEDERRFLAQYSAIRRRHLWQTTLSHLPSSIRPASVAEEDKDLVEDAKSARLDLNRHVFARVLEDIGAVRPTGIPVSGDIDADSTLDDADDAGASALDATSAADADPIELLAGKGMLLPYRVVRALLRKHRVALA